jgi:hypothetical protein
MKNASILLVIGATALALSALLIAEGEPPADVAVAPAPAPPVLGVRFARSDIEAVGVYPHPLLPGRVVLSTKNGLEISEDFGAHWTVLEQAATERIGAVRRVAYVLAAEDTFYVGSSKGVWVTTDAGKTLTQMGAKAKGLASDDVVDIDVYYGDAAYRTLLAAHGESAAGLSMSFDGGKTWRVIASDYFVRRIVGSDLLDTQLYMLASRRVAPKVSGIYYVAAPGELWQECERDIMGADVATSLYGTRGGNEWSRTDSFVATADAGLKLVSRAGALSQRVGPADVNNWTSVGVSYGPVPDKQLAYAYNPDKLGLVLSLDGFATWRAVEGLPVGPLIKDDAVVRTNANGTVFYAIINGLLWMGSTYSERIVVTQAALSPVSMLWAPELYAQAKEVQRTQIAELAKAPRAAQVALSLRDAMHETSGAFADYRFTVTARVLCPPGQKPSSVTVDLGPIGDDAAAPMFDDGKHGDGAAGDGVWGTHFRFIPNPDRDKQKRIRWPGQVGLVVTAVSQDGRSSGGCPAVFAVNARPEDMDVYDEPRNYQPNCKGAQAQSVDAPDEASHGSMALRIEQGAGPWDLTFGFASHDTGYRNSSGFEALTFWVRSEGKLDDLRVTLRDNPLYAPKGQTAGLSVLKKGMISGAAGEYQHVVVPLELLWNDGGDFKPCLMGSLVISGQGKGPVWIDRVRFTRSADGAEAQASGKPSAKPARQPVRAPAKRDKK